MICFLGRTLILYPLIFKEETDKMTLLEKTQLRLAELNLQPKKALGQNFLISDRIVDRILEKIKEVQPKQLIEVGPGLGSLTDRLLDLSLPLQLIELDLMFFQYWKSRGVEVFNEDALKWDWNLDHPANTLFVSNLPYQISSRILIERTLDHSLLCCMILMFQKEVAQKIRAKIGTENYGMLAVFTQTFWKIEKLVDAGTIDFYPPPKIASQVLVFQPKSSELDARKFFRLLKVAFSHPRKILLSNLSALAPRKNLEPIFESRALSEKVRAEQLSIDDFHYLYDRLSSKWL
jgi:16S rRNA (adenine1518-N6/adenine1519-N6)-dimethyltransferase